MGPHEHQYVQYAIYYTPMGPHSHQYVKYAIYAHEWVHMNTHIYSMSYITTNWSRFTPICHILLTNGSICTPISTECHILLTNESICTPICTICHISLTNRSICTPIFTISLSARPCREWRDFAFMIGEGHEVFIMLDIYAIYYSQMGPYAHQMYDIVYIIYLYSLSWTVQSFTNGPKCTSPIFSMHVPISHAHYFIRTMSIMIWFVVSESSYNGAFVTWWPTSHKSPHFAFWKIYAAEYIFGIKILQIYFSKTHDRYRLPCYYSGRSVKKVIFY